MNDRLMIAAMAMQGMLASPDCIGDAQAVSGDAIELADALLAAAGEKEKDGSHLPARRLDDGVMYIPMDRYNQMVERDNRVIGDLESKLAACERERDSARFLVKAHNDIEKAAEARRIKDRAEIASLRRRLEPLAVAEMYELGDKAHFGSLAGANQINAVVVAADVIRARRQP